MAMKLDCDTSTDTDCWLCTLHGRHEVPHKQITVELHTAV